MSREVVLVCCAVCKTKTHRRCSRCLNIYYCSTEHQRQDWKRHKIECTPKLKEESKSEKLEDCSSTIEEASKKEQQKEDTSITKQSSDQISSQTGNSANRRLKKARKKNTNKEGSVTSDISKHCSQSDTDKQTSENVSKPPEPLNLTLPGPSSVKNNSVTSSVVYTNQDLTKESAITYEGSSEKEILSESAQQLNTDFATTSASNIAKMVTRTDIKMPILPNYGVGQPSRVKEYPEATLKSSGAPFSSIPNSYYMDPSDPCYEICHRVIRDMTQYGVCVLDNFLGKDRGLMVLDEVLKMYRSGIFTAGQLVSNPGSSTTAQTVRSDRITWIDGKESHCTNIKLLINQVDNIVLRANKMANNGKMGDYVINGRTKAMVACYPGSGSHYVKHVDNPNKDGRCITAIYYLNLDWDVRRSGGLLRVFPEGTNKVADIAPIFDRMLFFWSDRRNPHEVQPAYNTRYAITLWYFDAHEREVALRNYKEHSQPSPSK